MAKRSIEEELKYLEERMKKLKQKRKEETEAERAKLRKEIADKITKQLNEEGLQLSQSLKWIDDKITITTKMREMASLLNREMKTDEDIIAWIDEMILKQKNGKQGK